MSSVSLLSHAKINREEIPYAQKTHLLSASTSELLDETIASYYLRYLPECRMNVAKGLAILYELQESQTQIHEAVALRSRELNAIPGHGSPSPDQGILRLLDEYEKEQKAISRERSLLQNHLKNENHKIVIIEGVIYSLPEPQRSVIVGRYIERMSWPAIQQKLKRSASRIFSLHKEGIHGIHSAIKNLSGTTGND